MLLRRIGLPFVGQQLKTTDQAAACDRRLDDLVDGILAKQAFKGENEDGLPLFSSRLHSLTQRPGTG